MKYLFSILLITVFISFCTKQPTQGDSSTIPSSLTTISQGTFSNGVHNVSGAVKLASDGAGKKYLVFTDLKTEAGPDIRIWMATSKDGSNYSEISSTVKVGSYALEVPGSVDTNSKKFVLVWCKQFSVLFGSAQLN